MEKDKTGLTKKDIEEHWMKIVGPEKRLKTIKTYIDWKKLNEALPQEDIWFDVGETQSTRCEVGLREKQIENLKFQMQEREVATKKEFVEYIKDINNLQKDWENLFPEDSNLTIISREEAPRLFELLDTMIPQEFTPFVYLRILENGLGTIRLGLNILDGIKEFETSNKESSIRFFYRLAYTTAIKKEEQNGITRISLDLAIKGDARDLPLCIYLPVKFRLKHRAGTSNEPEEVKNKFIKWWYTLINRRMTKIKDDTDIINIIEIQPARSLFLWTQYCKEINVKEGYRQVFEKLCKLPAIGFEE